MQLYLDSCLLIYALEGYGSLGQQTLRQLERYAGDDWRSATWCGWSAWWVLCAALTRCACWPSAARMIHRAQTHRVQTQEASTVVSP
jgi:hypothetical protein